MLENCPDCTKLREKDGHKLPADMKERESQLQEYRKETSKLPTFRKPSKMPADFEDLERKNTADMKIVFPLLRNSFLPPTPSAAPGGTCSPSTLRVPPSTRKSIRSFVQKSVRLSVAPGHSTWPESNSRYPAAPMTVCFEPVRAIRDPQPSVRLSVALPAQKPSRPETSIRPPGCTTKPQALSRKAHLTPAELLKRGPPRNIAASAFYQNPDGDEAHANIIPNSQSRQPSTVTKLRTYYGGHTAAPRRSEASLDLEKLMSEVSVTQSTIPEGGSRAPSMSSRHPDPNLKRTGRGHSQMLPRESSVLRQSPVQASASASTSPQRNTKTLLLAYKTMAGEESKFLTNIHAPLT